MSGFGRSASSSQANSSSTTSTSSVNNNIQPTGGGVAFGSLDANGPVGINVSTSDFGSVNGALTLAQGALDTSSTVAQKALQSNGDLAKYTIDAATSMNDSAFNLTKSITQGLFDFSSASNASVAASAQNSLDFANNALSTVAQSVSSGYDSTTTVKYIAYGAAAVAIAIALIYASR